MSRRPGSVVAIAVTAIGSAIASLQGQEAAADPVRPANAPLVITRAWLPVASVTMAFPASARTYREDLVARASDEALLAAIREATADRAAVINHYRDATGRYFVAAVAPEAAESVLRTMERAAGTPLPARLVEGAVAGMRADFAFRGDLPRSRFDRVLDSRLRGESAAPDGDATEATTGFDGLADEVAATTPAARWGPPVWVLVDDEGATSAPDPPPPPLPVAGSAATAPSAPVSDQVPGDAVTRWVGSAFRFPAETTLVEACFLRMVLEESLESRRDPDLFEFDTEIDALGHLVVRLSTSANASVSWDARLDDAIVHLGSEEGRFRLGQLLTSALSRWSRELAPAPGAGRAAAEALLRGATDLQAAAFANSTATAPSAERLREVASGVTLVLRVVYGSS